MAYLVGNCLKFLLLNPTLKDEKIKRDNNSCINNGDFPSITNGYLCYDQFGGLGTSEEVFGMDFFK
jgi:hypothetical protein